MIKEITSNEVLRSAEEAWHLPESQYTHETIIANCLRRVASYKCPCSITTLVNESQQALKFLFDDSALDDVERIVNLLLVSGDLLELSDVISSDVNVKSTWIFAAPPSFVIRPNGNAFIVGIGPDGNLPIPLLLDRIKYDGCKRIIIPNDQEKLSETLSNFGLSQISESLWLKLPRKSTAEDYLEQFDKWLMSSPSSDHISEITLLDKGRWVSPTTQTGRYIARRPQQYGPKYWCYVETENGKLKRFIDIPVRLNGIPQRQCDVAWLLQMAIDKVQHQPQEFTIQIDGQNCIFNFYSPIPLWAERRLLVLGSVAKKKNCLFSYEIPKQETLTEEAFLYDYLWLRKKEITQ
ncbi:hypothetical protein IDJ75_11430 [Mucilaginibacter rigui]|uniref:Uncharacterized protein n=1 Tax=Mucilaginibacter rigui TaxID=534635 RepID=A0ABR7X5N0_9SPHI|nr:hypothetical protein [Mucilaginibacter rigui]MBD1385893.1 hypothetical protein [Mucilaginibacter rigui]